MSDRIERHLRITVETDRVTEQFQGTLQHIEADIHVDRIAGLLFVFFRCLQLQQRILHLTIFIFYMQLLMVRERKIRHPEIAVSGIGVFKRTADE